MIVLKEYTLAILSFLMGNTKIGKTKLLRLQMFIFIMTTVENMIIILTLMSMLWIALSAIYIASSHF